MATVNDLIIRALKMVSIIGNNETLDTADAADSLAQINGILDEWNSRKLMNYAVSKEAFPLVSGTDIYTIGSGGDFNTTRPVEIVTAFIRDSGGIDYPVQIIQNDEYDDIAQKNIQSTWPHFLFYNPLFPLAEIRLYPVPTATYDLHISSWIGFPSYATTGDTVALPTGFNELLTYQLAVDMCSYFANPIPPVVQRKLNKMNMRLAATTSRTWKPTSYSTVPSSGVKNSEAFRTFIPENV